MQTVSQTAVAVKTFVLVTLPFAWGLQDGAQGKSEYTGWELFIGPRLTQYRKGWKAGKAIMAQKLMREAVDMPAEFVGALDDMAHGVTYCKPGVDWTAVNHDRIGD